jgi:hypothetical protein
MGPRQTATAGDLFRALNALNEVKRRNPGLRVTPPSQSRSGLWDVSFPGSDRALFDDIERMADELITWEASERR